MGAVRAFHLFLLLLTFGGLTIFCGLAASDAADSQTGNPALAQTDDSACLLLRAARVFDGKDLHANTGVLLAGREIIAVGSPSELRGRADREMDLGDSTILPGFIELHAHVAFRKVSRETVLRHGITTVRDVGGPLLPP